MPLRHFELLAFEDIMLLQPGLLEEGSLHWLLSRYPDLLFPYWLFVGWKGESLLGRPAWPAESLMGLLLLRYSEVGTTRVGSLRRAKHDAQWRAALRLPWHVNPPHEKTMREFEAFLKTDHPVVDESRIVLLFEHWTRLGLEGGVVGDEVLAVIDSTPMWCFGAVLGTVNLLGEGLRSLAKRWARARKVPLTTVAAEWDAPLVLAKSTKGYFVGTDWSDATARSGVLDQLAELVTRCVGVVTAGLDGVSKNKLLPLARRSRNLLRVVDEDLETAEDGTIRVVRRTTSDRLISHTDPDAQHFRKSKSKVCQGFKLHVLGDALSGLIIALSVTPGGAHDSTQAHPLIKRAKALYDDLREVLADAAYGGMPVRREVYDGVGVTLLAPPIKSSHKGLGKVDFTIDFAKMVMTCPGGVSTSMWKPAKHEGQITQAFIWSKGSEFECGCRESCPVHRPREKTKKEEKTKREVPPTRRLVLHAQEQELRALRADWERPEVRQRYRQRSQGERLINEMTRRGARRAYAWGLDNAQLQAYCIAAVNNLKLLARKLAKDATHQLAA